MVHKDITSSLGVSSKVSFLKQKRYTHSLKVAGHLVGHLIFALHLGTFIFNPHVYFSSVQFPV